MVGARTWSVGEHGDHGSCDQTHRLDPKKKTMGAAERNEEARVAWREQCKELDARHLIVSDECGSTIGLRSLSARAPKGQRAYGSAPGNRGKTTTLIAAVVSEGMSESMIIEGATNAVAFEHSREEILAPSLISGQMAIMDNLAAHTGRKVQQLIEQRGCQRLLLPGHSPDFSPVEETCSKVKTCLRRAGARTREALQEAICQALLTVTAQDAHGWFGHCGYFPAQGLSSWLNPLAYRCRRASPTLLLPVPIVDDHWAGWRLGSQS
ncbi:MAG TPA: transposase [Ktedonobacteraceae bacterium]|nr:transposase [Ktedonobacteraceae bacterium]